MILAILAADAAVRTSAMYVEFVRMEAWAEVVGFAVPGVVCLAAVPFLWRLARSCEARGDVDAPFALRMTSLIPLLIGLLLLSVGAIPAIPAALSPEGAILAEVVRD